MISKILKYITLFIFIISSFNVACAQEKTPFVASVQATSLNVRTGRSTGHRVVSTLKHNDEVVVYEIRNSWAKIAFPKPLWIYKKYIHIQGNWATVIGDRVNLRDLKTDNVRSRVITQARRGDRLKIKKITNDWVQVNPPEGAYAWVSKKFLKYISAYQVWLAQKRDAEVYEHLMSQAQSLLDAQLQISQETASYQEVISLLEQARLLSKNDMDVQIIDLKIAQAKHNQQLVDKLKKIRADKQKMALDLQSMKQEYQKEVAQNLAEIAKLKESKIPTYLSVGWVSSVGRYYNRPASFRLTKGAQILYYLDSTAYDLNLYIDKWVGIRGKVVDIKNSPLKLIKVTHIDILRVGDMGFKLKNN